MKIGILTYHFVSNFGANLQTLSTFHGLKNRGHQPLILNWVPEDLENYYTKVVPPVQNNAFHEFAAKHYTSISKLCRSSQDIATVIDSEQLDLVVIGSDAVLTYVPILSRFALTRRGPKYFKPCIDSDFPNAFWGDFLNYTHRDVKVALMSGSAQNTNYRNIKFRKKQFKNAISKFSYISVRDIWTQKMLHFLSNGEVLAPITPDPVFAFNNNVSEQYTREYILKRFDIKGDYALLTIDNKGINAQWKKQLEYEFSRKGITLIELPQANKTPQKVLSQAVKFPIDPLEWYCLIKYSSAYIGELMHPVLVSLHNSVPVYVIDTYGFKKSSFKYGINPESSKTYQIMNRFNLMEYYCNINALHLLDTPELIVNKLLKFDKQSCSSNASMMFTEYDKMMNSILQ